MGCLLTLNLIKRNDGSGLQTCPAPLAPGLSVSATVIASTSISPAIPLFEQFVEDNHLEI